MNDKLSLTELQLIIRDSLYVSLPGLYWITAEISELKENYAGHCYLELVEKHPDEINVRAKIKGIIWSNRLKFIKPLFENITGEPLRSGLKILVHAKIEYHEIYGLSLVINDIDPAFTIGEMAIRRQQIIKKLEEEGVITMNRDLEFPVLPQRIAVISSEAAAGYTDFIRHLKGNTRGYGFTTLLFEAVMQGQETEESIINAFDLIAEKISLFDVVVIVRGGGSQSDLSWFDNYRIAYHITQFPLPVITGIGHEKDLSVTDIVAFRAEKTPTAVADFLTGSMAAAEEHLLNLSAEITSLTSEIVQRYSERLNNSRMRLVPLARISLAGSREYISGLMISMLGMGKDYLAETKYRLASDLSGLRSGATALITARKADLSGHATALNHLNPANVLARGYTITSSGGRIVKTAAGLQKGESIVTRFIDGKVTSTISDSRLTEKDKPEN